MEHRTKQDLALYNLVSEFEISYKSGEMKFLDERSYGQLIRYYEDEEKIDKAIDVAKLAIKQFKYRSEFYITISNLYINCGKPEQSLKYLTKAESIAPYENEIILLKARAYCDNKQYDLAFAALEDVAVYASEQDQMEIYLCEASIHHNMQNYESMYFALIEVLKIDHTNIEALQLLWTATELTKKYIHSIAFHQELLDKNPYNYVAWYNLGHGLAYEGNYEEAADALEYSFLINQDFEFGYMDCADVLCQIKQYERALGVYEEAMIVFGKDSDLLTNIAACQLHLNRINEAKHNLYKAVRLEPHCDEIYYLLGECYSKQEKWYSAINAYHKAIGIEDGSEDYYLGVARAYIAVEEYNKATVNFQHAVAIGPEQTKYWNEFASFLIKMGLYNEAEQILDEAEQFTFGADLMYIRALVHIAQKERTTAIQILEEALIEDYNAHNILFTLSPELEVDKDVVSMINYYKSEQE